MDSDAERTGMGAGLIIHQRDPLNAEPPLDRLCAAFITPAADFYIRTHGTIPRLDAGAHRLRLEGQLARPLELDMAALQRDFAPHTVTASLQCAGNRRAELAAVGPVEGAPWDAGAIGTAAWTGVRLADVLAAAGCDLDAPLHAAFEAADEVALDGRHVGFGGSIPLAKARSPEVLLAFAMNGRPLRPEHGFPLRVVAPGVVGARSVKWLRTIRVQDHPSDNPYQQQEYRLLPQGQASVGAPPEAGLMLQDLPLNAAICTPAHGAIQGTISGATLPAGPVRLAGYALAGGRAIARVELTADDGRSWHAATLAQQPGEPAGNPWAWTLWQASLDLPAGEHEVAVRAWDTAAQTQPERLESVWNHKGYMNAAWHRVRLRCR